jgi:hypothetical protein
VDDVPSAPPADSHFCEEFSLAYRKMCERLNVKLAENFPLNEGPGCDVRLDRFVLETAREKDLKGEKLGRISFAEQHINSEGMAEISRQIEQYQSAVPIPKDFQVKH